MTQTRTRVMDGVSVQSWHDNLRALGPEWQPLRDALSRVPASGILPPAQTGHAEGRA